MYPLRLPVVATSFTEPVSLSSNDFSKRWQALEGPDREEQSALSSIDLAKMQDLLTTQMHFACTENADALLLATTFRTGSVSSSGSKISVGCLVRIEPNPSVRYFKQISLILPDK